MQKLFDLANRVINFNYTNVVEQIYSFSNVEHIHGDINDTIIIGCDTFDRLNKSLIRGEYPSGGGYGRPKDILIERERYYDCDDDGNWFKKASIKQFFDDVIQKTQKNEGELSNLLRLRSKEYLEQRQAIITSLANEYYDEVHIIGHSLGKADWSVFNALQATEVICYFHSDRDRRIKQSYIAENGWDFTLQPDSVLFDGNPA